MNRAFSGPAQSAPHLSGDDIFADPYVELDEEPRRLDLRELWSTLYRNRYIFLVTLAVALLAGLASTLLMTKMYRATSSIQIEQEGVSILGSEYSDPVGDAQNSELFLQTQLDVIRSRYLAERVAQDLRLFNGEFLIAMGKDAPENSEGGQVLHRTVVDTLIENLQVSLPRNSRVARISFVSPNPDLATRVANSYATNVITSNLQRKFDTSAYARDFLARQLQDAKRRLEDSERAMLAYARQARLLDTSGASTGENSPGPSSLTASSLVQLNNSHSAAVAHRIEAQQRWSQARGTSPMTLPAVLENPAIQELVQQRAELRGLYEQERQRRRAEFPSVRQAAARIAELDQQIASLASNIQASIHQEFQVALDQEQALSRRLSALKGELLGEQDRSVRYNILKREVDTSRGMYEGLFQRYREVSAQAGVTANNISILDQAQIPTNPVSPKPLMNMGLAGFAGLALAFLLVLIRERFVDVIRNPDDITDKLHAATLGVIPMLAGESLTDALANPRSPITESYHALRTALELSSPAGLPFSLVFTSSLQGEGKSTSAYAIARDFARVGRKTLLIDADLRKPSLHNLIAGDNSLGLSNVLSAQKTLNESIQRQIEANLDFLSAGPLPPNPAELLSAAPLNELLTNLRSEYDLVVVDAPPVMGFADAPLLASQFGGAVFVAEANRAHRGQAKAALGRLSSSRVRLLGVVLTKFNPQKAGYGEDYGYGYRYGN